MGDHRPCPSRSLSQQPSTMSTFPSDTTNSTPSSDPFLKRLSENAEKYPSKTAITFLASGPNGGRVEQSLTYQELLQQTTLLAQKLLNSSISKGDRVVLVYPPSLDYMVAFVACLFAGVIAVPVFPPSRNDTLHMFTKIVEGSGANHALTNTNYSHMKKLAGMKETLTRLSKKKKDVSSWPEHLEWIVTNNNDTSSTKKTTKTLPEPSTSDIAFLQYTSGSTSTPKGVMITHGNLAHNLSIICNELQATQSTVVCSWLPQYHDMGLIGSYLGVLYCGGSGYYMSPLSFLQRPMLWMEAVSKYQATHLQAPNFAFRLTARKYSSSNDSKLDLSSVRHIINGAEPVDEESIEAFASTFGKFGLDPKVIYPTYGLAEHTVFVCSGGTQRLTVDKRALEVDGLVKIVESSSDEEAGTTTSRLLGCGVPSRQGVDVRIVDTESCQELTEGKVGEIWIHSASKAAGYFGKPEETKEDFHADLAGQENESGDGYLKTGDLGFLHNKELFICGRLKDLIIVGGRNYYPQDIEGTAEATSDALRPGCSAAFTIDSTHQGGEEVALVAELREVPASKDVASVCEPLVQSIRSAVSQEQSLAIHEIVLLRPKTVPKTTSGKIARAWCRKAFVAGTLQVVYQKTFKVSPANGSLEIEQGTSDTAVGAGSSQTAPPVSQRPTSAQDVEKLRSMDREELYQMLAKDMATMGGVAPESIQRDAAIVTMMDSLSVSQFKGLLEAKYAVKISDEYLFRESTTPNKLVEVVKLGYAPDDEQGGSPAAGASSAVAPASASGLAGAMGCPPGVCCVIL